MNAGNEPPPVIQILLSEDVPTLGSQLELKKYLQKLLPELRRQALWSRDHYRYFDETERPRSGRSIVNPSGSLNPLSSFGICRSRECRLLAAQNVARSVGLYSDLLIMTDTVTGRLYSHKRLSAADRYDFVTDILVLQSLRPLIAAGQIEFGSFARRFCQGCFDGLQARVVEAARSLAAATFQDLTFRLESNHIFVDERKVRGETLGFIVPLTAAYRRLLAEGKSVEEVAADHYTNVLQRELQGILMETFSASRTHAAIFSSSGFEALALRELEGLRIEKGDLELWEPMHSVQLPWVRDLSVADIVRLKEEAGNALPRLRELLAAAVAKSSRDGTQDVRDVIFALREQAAAVEAELRALGRKSEHRFRTVSGLLALTVSLGGFGSGAMGPGLALGTLLSALGLIHSSAHREQQECLKITSLPGYVLVKAKELLHRHR